MHQCQALVLWFIHHLRIFPIDYQLDLPDQAYEHSMLEFTQISVPEFTQISLRLLPPKAVTSEEPAQACLLGLARSLLGLCSSCQGLFFGDFFLQNYYLIKTLLLKKN